MMVSPTSVSPTCNLQCREIEGARAMAAVLQAGLCFSNLQEGSREQGQWQLFCKLAFLAFTAAGSPTAGALPVRSNQGRMKENQSNVMFFFIIRVFYPI